eukprot:scaffold12_cov368-Pavlova_lutheri.AAC.6
MISIRSKSSISPEVYCMVAFLSLTSSLAISTRYHRLSSGQYNSACLPTSCGVMSETLNNLPDAKGVSAACAGGGSGAPAVALHSEQFLSSLSVHLGPVEESHGEQPAIAVYSYQSQPILAMHSISGKIDAKHWFWQLKRDLFRISTRQLFSFLSHLIPSIASRVEMFASFSFPSFSFLVGRLTSSAGKPTSQLPSGCPYRHKFSFSGSHALYNLSLSVVCVVRRMCTLACKRRMCLTRIFHLPSTTKSTGHASSSIFLSASSLSTLLSNVPPNVPASVWSSSRFHRSHATLRRLRGAPLVMARINPSLLLLQSSKISSNVRGCSAMATSMQPNHTLPNTPTGTRPPPPSLSLSPSRSPSEPLSLSHSQSLRTSLPLSPTGSPSEPLSLSPTRSPSEPLSLSPTRSPSEPPSLSLPLAVPQNPVPPTPPVNLAVKQQILSTFLPGLRSHEWRRDKKHRMYNERRATKFIGECPRSDTS